MTITAYGRTALIASRATDQFTSIKAQLASQQSQLSTGKTATSYAGLGAGASVSLNLRSQLSALDTYGANIADAQLRTNLMTSGLTRADRLSQSLVTDLNPVLDQETFGQTGLVSSPEDGLKQLIDIFNEQVNGRYLFSGRASDTRAVVDYDLMINGDATHAGLKTLIGERQAADLGADGLGRLTLGTTGTSTTVAEGAAGLPFGFKISGASAAGGRVTTTVSMTPPASAGFSVASQPVQGDELSLILGLPDGTSQTVKLTAGTANSDTAFAIGATAADTATNIKTALGIAIGSVAAGALAAQSTVAAATNFFAASAGTPPLRVSGGGTAATATSLVAGTEANTVVWYRGETSATPRDGTVVRIGADQSVAIGAQANEPAFQAALAGFGALAADTFTPVSAASQARFTAVVEKIRSAIGNTSSSLQNVATDMVTASKAMGLAADRLKATKVQAQDMLAGVEDAEPTEAAAKLLATQTRLQASYQVTSTVLKLSLTDYL